VRCTLLLTASLVTRLPAALLLPTLLRPLLLLAALLLAALLLTTLLLTALLAPMLLAMLTAVLLLAALRLLALLLVELNRLGALGVLIRLFVVGHVDDLPSLRPTRMAANALPSKGAMDIPPTMLTTRRGDWRARSRHCAPAPRVAPA